MIRISDMGGATLGIYQTDLNRLWPSMMGYMYRYAADSENFWLRDKFRIIAVIHSPDILSAHPQEIILFPQLPDDLLWRTTLTAHLPASLRSTNLP